MAKKTYNKKTPGKQLAFTVVYEGIIPLEYMENREIDISGSNKDITDNVIAYIDEYPDASEGLWDSGLGGHLDVTSIEVRVVEEVAVADDTPERYFLSEDGKHMYAYTDEVYDGAEELIAGLNAIDEQTKRAEDPNIYIICDYLDVGLNGSILLADVYYLTLDEALDNAKWFENAYGPTVHVKTLRVPKGDTND